MDAEKKEKIKQFLMSTPEQQEAEFKKGFDMMDKEKKGYVTLETLQAGFEKLGEMFGKPPKEPTPEEKAASLKILDPQGTGKVTWECYKTFMFAGIEKFKAMGGKI